VPSLQATSVSLDHSVTSFKDAFAQAKHVIVIAGAGLSAPSGWQISNLSFSPDLGTPMAGIPTFRDGGGSVATTWLVMSRLTKS
jgi:hypothetical protein